MRVEITGAALIGQKERRAVSRSAYGVNPENGETLAPPIRIASQDDVDDACQLAASALDAYRGRSLEARAVFLETIARNFAAMHDALLDRASAETGLPVDRLEGEFTRAVNQLKLFAGVVRNGEWLDLRIDPALPDRMPLPRADIRSRHIALGPVAVFGSSNFPFAFSTAGGDTASAFAAGCPVIVKGHLAHPGTGEIAARAIVAAVVECGLPDGVFSYLPGANDTGAALVRHPAIAAVGFTGSRLGGVALGSIAAARPEPIPVYAEMSSINPVFLFPAALNTRAEALASEFVTSLTTGMGQLCTNPGLLVAHAGIDLDRFVSAATTLIARQTPGPMLTAGIHAAYDRGVAALDGNSRITTLATGVSVGGLNRSPAVFFQTSKSEFLADPSLAEEVFGASALLVTCADADEMREVAEALEGQLTASLQIDAPDYLNAKALLPILERKAGRIIANGWPTGVEVCDAMVHGGPFPATSDSRATSVGTMAIRRFLRPVSYQNLPGELLPYELTEAKITRLPHLRDGNRLLPAV